MGILTGYSDDNATGAADKYLTVNEDGATRLTSAETLAKGIADKTVEHSTDGKISSRAKDLVKASSRKNNTTNVTVTNQLTQYGWAYLQGTGVPFVTGAVSFPESFDDAPIVVASSSGFKDGSNPATLEELSDTGSLNCVPGDVTTTGFQFSIEHIAATNIPTTRRVGISWIAIGTKNRTV